MSEAVALFEAFHGFRPKTSQVPFLKQSTPEQVLFVGKLYGIMYKAPKERMPLFHKFSRRNPASLFVSADGKQIYIMGGGYRFTDRGFIG